ncbi:RrF2 family transcriptional regulator [Methylocystis parvus]|uniref:Rrf2 family transcriptional regulator n=1 Tax=Methylocystis parvus TaxID=134 RepID=A0A6B8M9Q9_9HYPH|nr:Rrf2 family transcriptional regulator [Methylocystis parvus]QGM99145.1 Rrf2 family transcriptional regulator [Methylocystis parvus]WBK00483.1 Rrf2 family transcriptional regulator [Methylocystis parvus OBBP]
MRLTTHADLCFRTLIFLGVAKSDGATIPQIAAAFGASEHHLRKVVQEMGRLNLVRATRGRSGGLRLAVSPAEVTIGGLLRLFEPEFAAAHCLGAGQNGCVIFGACGLQNVFDESLRALFVVLDRYTLADVLDSSRGVAAKLGLSAAPPPV